MGWLIGSKPKIVAKFVFFYAKIIIIRNVCLTVFVGDFFDETSSQSSTHSEKYSNWAYYSADEHEHEHVVSPNSRFCPGNKSAMGVKYSVETPRLTRNRSLVDTRSQLLHRSLVDEVNRRRLFKTVDAVENIGFRSPYEGLSKTPKTLNGTYQVRLTDHAKRQEQRARRG